MIIENRDDYVKSWDEVHFLPGALAALRRLGQSTYRVVIVTNQSAVGRRIISLELAHEINRRVIARIVEQGGRIDAAYLCPHHPADRCACRKPAPGMFLRAARELDLDLGRSYAIGDAASDIEAARSAGVPGILVLTGRGREQAPPPHETPVVTDLSAAVEHLLTHGESRP